MADKSVTAPPPPRGAGASGARLWRQVLGKYGLEAHELVVLREAVRTADLVDKLSALIDRAGLIGDDGKMAPAVVEIRQQRIVLARLLSSLRIPAEAPEPGFAERRSRNQRRPGTRGVYSLGGGA
jgi:hypothetical protein